MNKYLYTVIGDLTVCLGRLVRADEGEGVVGGLLQVVVGELGGDAAEGGVVDSGPQAVVVDRDTHAGNLDFVLLVVRDRAGRVEGDGVEDELDAARVPGLVAVLLEELPRRDGAVHLEAVVQRGDRGVGRHVPAEIVQEGRHGLDLDIHAVPQRLVGGNDERSEEPGAHLVLEDGLGAVVAGELLRETDDGRVDDGYAGDGDVREGLVHQNGLTARPEGAVSGRGGHEGRRPGEQQRKALGDMHLVE